MSTRAIGFAFLLPVFLISQEPTGEIRGIIVDDLKAVPLHAANIELRGEGIRRTVQAGATGYRISGLPAGVYDLTIGGSFLVPVTIRSVRVQAGESRVLPSIQMTSNLVNCGSGSLRYFRPLDRTEPGKGSLAGVIVDEKGHPLGDARVRIDSFGAALTDGEGRFSIDSVPAPGRYRIEVSHEGYYTETYSDFQVQAGYEAVNGSLSIESCERCEPALRPLRLSRVCE